MQHETMYARHSPRERELERETGQTTLAVYIHTQMRVYTSVCQSFPTLCVTQHSLSAWAWTGLPSDSQESQSPLAGLCHALHRHHYVCYQYSIVINTIHSLCSMWCITISYLDLLALEFLHLTNIHCPQALQSQRLSQVDHLMIIG